MTCIPTYMTLSGKKIEKLANEARRKKCKRTEIDNEETLWHKKSES